MGRSVVISNINQALPTNGNDEISAQDLRGVLISDIANEFMNLEDDAEIPVYSSVKSYKLGKLVLNQDVIWRALVNVNPTQVPSTLPITSNTFWKVQGSISLNESTQPEIELETSTKEDVFVSPRRFWQGIARFKALVGTFLEKITFGKGIALGNNDTPTNGDIWFNNGYFGRQGGFTTPFLTSLNGKVGRVLFVSKDGSNDTAIIGNQNFPYSTIQAAVTASSSGDTIWVHTGIYSENILLTGKSLTIKLFNATVTNITGNIATIIEGFGKCTVGTLAFGAIGGPTHFIKNLNITTFNVGSNQGDTMYFYRCIINNIPSVAASGAVQNIWVDDCDISCNASGLGGSGSNTALLRAKNSIIRNSVCQLWQADNCDVLNSQIVIRNLFTPKYKNCNFNSVAFYCLFGITPTTVNIMLYNVIWKQAPMPNRIAFGFIGTPCVLNWYLLGTITDLDITVANSSLQAANLTYNLFPIPTVVPTAVIDNYLQPKFTTLIP